MCLHRTHIQGIHKFDVFIMEFVRRPCCCVCLFFSFNWLAQKEQFPEKMRTHNLRILVKYSHIASYPPGACLHAQWILKWKSLQVCFGILLTKATQYQNNTLPQTDRLRNQECNNKSWELGRGWKGGKTKENERNPWADSLLIKLCIFI